MSRLKKGFNKKRVEIEEEEEKAEVHPKLTGDAFIPYRPGMRQVPMQQDLQQKIPFTPQPSNRKSSSSMEDDEQADVELNLKDLNPEKIPDHQAQNPRICYHKLPTKTQWVKNVESLWYGQVVHVCPRDGFDSCDFFEPDLSTPCKQRCLCGVPPKRGISRKMSDDGSKSENYGRWFMTCGLRRCRKFGWLGESQWDLPEGFMDPLVTGTSRYLGKRDDLA